MGAWGDGLMDNDTASDLADALCCSDLPAGLGVDPPPFGKAFPEWFAEVSAEHPDASETVLARLTGPADGLPRWSAAAASLATWGDNPAVADAVRSAVCMSVGAPVPDACAASAAQVRDREECFVWLNPDSRRAALGAFVGALAEYRPGVPDPRVLHGTLDARPETPGL